MSFDPQRWYQYSDFLQIDPKENEAQKQINEKLDEMHKLWKGKAGNSFREVFSQIPPSREVQIDISSSDIRIVSEEEFPQVKELAQKLIPWRKGPFTINNLLIDSEWDSSLKWNRLNSFLSSKNWEGKRILDIGCNNGYFMFKMLGLNPDLILGIDPVLRCVAQFEFLQHFANNPILKFLPIGIEHIKHLKNNFDLILSMGIIYHHRHPIEQLTDIYNSLRSGGTLVLETIGIPGENPICLFPQDRYANMSNVWFVPTLSCLINWLERSHYKNIEVISTDWNGIEEQRSTDWSSPKSYQETLSKNDPKKTIEGYDAPMRFMLSAQKA